MNAPTASPAAVAAANIRRWRLDPVCFVREVFKVEPDAWQARILRAFPQQQRLAMKAAKGPGKSCVLAWLVWNYLMTRRHPKVVCVSITGENLRDGLWTELAKWQGKSVMLTETFTWTKERITLNTHPETWWAVARQFAKGSTAEQQANTLAGIHEENVLFVLDEVGAMPDGVMAAADAGLTTGPGCKIVIAGNPTHLSGPLYRACTLERELWYVVEITGDPDDPQRAPRIDINWARQHIAKYGRDNPWTMCNVFGQFPPTSMNSLLGPDQVTASMKKVMLESEIIGQAKVIGVDVARYGDDRTAICPRQGRACFTPIIMRNADTMEVAGRVVDIAIKWNADAVFIDATGGFGVGVIDAVRQSGVRVIEVNFSSKAHDEQYFNLRSEIWWNLAAWVKSGGKLPDMPELVRELTEPTYYLHNNKLRLEEKEAIKARLGYSPDIGDGIACTFAMPIQPGAGIGGRGVVKAKQDYDPLGSVRRKR